MGGRRAAAHGSRKNRHELSFLRGHLYIHVYAAGGLNEPAIEGGQWDIFCLAAYFIYDERLGIYRADG